MNEGKVKILEMLQDGKISVDEAMNLLKQFPDEDRLQSPPPPPIPNRPRRNFNDEDDDDDWDADDDEWDADHDDWSNELKEDLKEAANDIRDGLNEGLREMQDSLSEIKWQDIVHDVGQELREAFSGVFSGVKSHTYPFEFTTDPVMQGVNTIKLLGKNDRVIIRVHDHDYIRVSGKYTTRHENQGISTTVNNDTIDIAPSDFNAIRSMYILCEVPQVLIKHVHAETINSTVEVNGIRAENALLITKNSPIVIYNSECSLLSAKTRNSNIEAEGVKSDLITLETTNAAIKTTRCTAEIMRLHTTNAQVRVDNANFKKLLVNTTNAKIKIDGLFKDEWEGDGCEREIEAHTTNAKISLDLPKGIGYAVKASTSYGKIKCELEDMDYVTESKHYILGKSRNYGQLPKKVNVHLSTSHSSVEISD